MQLPQAVDWGSATQSARQFPIMQLITSSKAVWAGVQPLARQLLEQVMSVPQLSAQVAIWLQSQGGFGYRRITVLLQREGWHVNKNMSTASIMVISDSLR